MKKLLRLFALIMTGTALVGTFCLSAPAWADGNAGHDGGLTGGGSCGKSGATVWWDTCYGATWRWYEADSDTIYIPGSAGVAGGTIKGCKSYGGGYYRLALEVYNPTTYNRSYNAEAASLGRQVGLFRTSSIGKAYGGFGWSSTPLHVFPDTYTMDQMAQKFNEWKEGAKNGTIRTENFNDVSWFCGDKIGSNKAGRFDAYSWVSSTVSEEKQTHDPDSTVNDAVTTEQEKVRVEFRHQLSYNSTRYITEGSAYDDAKTNWSVQVTQDGRVVPDVVSTPSGVASTAGGQRETWWSPWLGASSVEVEIPAGGSTKVCSKIDYNPKNIGWKLDEATDRYVGDAETTNGSASSTACITIQREKMAGNGGKINFWSESNVHVPVQNEMTSQVDGYAESKTKNNTGSVGLGTFADHLTVNFDHIMHYDHTGITETYANDEMPSEVACTEYEVTRTSSGSAYDDDNYDGNVKISTRGDSGVVKETTKYCINTTGHSGSMEASRTDNYEIKNIQKGETVKVCQKISYQPKYVYLNRVAIYRRRSDGHTVEVANPSSANLTGLVFDHYKYTMVENGTSGEGYSEVCVEVTRPPDPSRGVSYNTGTSSLYPMFAGETSKVGYDLKMRGSFYDRIEAVQVNTFQVTAAKGYSAASLKGNFSGSSSTPNPCDLYRNQIGSSYMRGSCGTIYSRSLGGSQSVNISTDTDYPVYVPNMVGDKYCITAGYYMSHWEMVTVSVKPFRQEPRLIYYYWMDYDAACVPIAKKPTLELWNGGLFSGKNSVLTSIAKRNNLSTPTGFTAARAADSKITTGTFNQAFGSWAEHLAIVDGSVNNFSSGAQLVLGPADIDMANSLSPLTISNTGETMGNSGISTNSAMLDRLNTYLASDQILDSMKVSSVNELGTGITSSKILRTYGPVTIRQNITLSPTSYNSVYELPQVIIYTDGDIYIDPAVTQVDAWLISTNGVVDTCKSTNSPIVDPYTAAKVNGAGGDTTCSENLIINGPIFAKKIITNRSYGADGISNDDQNKIEGNDSRAASAEIFNLSADTYLWAYAQAGRYKSSYTEAYSRELPPRY